MGHPDKKEPTLPVSDGRRSDWQARGRNTPASSGAEARPLRPGPKGRTDKCLVLFLLKVRTDDFAFVIASSHRSGRPVINGQFHSVRATVPRPNAHDLCLRRRGSEHQGGDGFALPAPGELSHFHAW